MSGGIEGLKTQLAEHSKHPLFYPLLANAVLLLAIALCFLSLRGGLRRLAAEWSNGDDVSSAGLEGSSSVEFHSLKDAEQKRSSLKQVDTEGNPEPIDPQKLATVLAEIDQWLVKKEDIQLFQKYKLTLAEELRTAIESSVERLHASCLQASDSAAAQPLYGEAGQLIALFPLADDPEVLRRASALSTAHSLTAARMEAIRRQRYNLWALDQIGGLLTWLEKGASSWTTKDNPQVVTRASLDLGAIDPSLLEPASLQLYTLAISKANEAISTTQQTDLAKRLTNPATKTRRTLGDF
jgi:hypothetical protein